MKCGKADFYCVAIQSETNGCRFGGSCEHQVPDKPAPSPEPAPSVDVGEGYERVTTGTLITEGVEWNLPIYDNVWRPVTRGDTERMVRGESFGGRIYRRRIPVPPAVPEWATRVIEICNRLWPKAEMVAEWNSGKKEVEMSRGDSSVIFDMEPSRPNKWQPAMYMAVSALYWETQQPAAPRYVYFNRADNPDEVIREGDEVPTTGSWEKISDTRYGVHLHQLICDVIRRVTP